MNCASSREGADKVVTISWPPSGKTPTIPGAIARGRREGHKSITTEECVRSCSSSLNLSRD